MLRVFRKLDEQKAQAIMGEYVLVFFLIVGMITAMTVFFKRAVQARYYDARQAMGTIIVERTNGQGVTGRYYTEYEPYYVNASSYSYHDALDKSTLDVGGSSGIFTRDTDEYTQVKTNSTTASPRNK